jgi:release factor glutamine methyltransferase
VKAVSAHTPVQYVIGRTEFCGLEFAVDDRVLIPRPETEMLVEEACAAIKSCGAGAVNAKILDLCTGSGNIAISLTKRVSSCKISASDVSQDALDMAALNAARHRAAERIEFIKSDLFDNINGIFDIIISNPPYIAGMEFDTLPAEVLKEPRIALYGGEDGLDLYRRLIPESRDHLADGGRIILEMGYGQRHEVVRILGRHQFSDISVRKDYNGIDRVVTARWIS